MHNKLSGILLLLFLFMFRQWLFLALHWLSRHITHPATNLICSLTWLRPDLLLSCSVQQLIAIPYLTCHSTHISCLCPAAALSLTLVLTCPCPYSSLLSRPNLACNYPDPDLFYPWAELPLIWSIFLLARTAIDLTYTTRPCSAAPDTLYKMSADSFTKRNGGFRK